MAEPRACRFTVDGRELRATEASSLAVALLQAGIAAYRADAVCEVRAALCGMGICHQCQVLVDGRLVRSCQEPVREGMEVRTRD